MFVKFSPCPVRELNINGAAKPHVCEDTSSRVEKLEREIARTAHTESAMCFSSFSAALESVLRAWELGEGDEVVLSAFSHNAAAASVLRTGATVRFIDTAPGSFHLDYNALEAAITEKTKAVIATDVGGVLCDYERIDEIVARKKQLFSPKNEMQAQFGRIIVVSDCAHGLGAERNGKQAGELADFTVFSLHTAPGGALTWKQTEALDSAALIRALSSFSPRVPCADAHVSSAWEYDILSTACECGMSEAAACLGLREVKGIPAAKARRQEIIRRYNEAFSDLGIRVLAHESECSCSSGYLYLMHIPDTFDGRRRAFIDYLVQNGVATDVHYKPLPMMTAYRNLGYDINDYPRAYASYQGEISLPLYASLTDEEVSHVIKTFRDCLATV